MGNNHLTDMLLLYRKGIICKKNLMREVSLFVYNFPLKNSRWEEDECSDFFCYFYPKIEKMIDTFEIREIPFEVYLVKSIKYQIKSFATREKAVRINLNILKNSEFWFYSKEPPGKFCYEEEKQYFSIPETIKKNSEYLEKTFKIDKNGIIANRTLRKRIIMLVLNNITLIQPDQLLLIAKLLDCDISWLENCRIQLELRIEKRSIHKKNLSERRNRLFCRLYYLHQEIIYETRKEQRREFDRKIHIVKKRISGLNQKLKNCTDNPTHKDIAELMNIPKGSVDSGLYYLKLYLENK